jgi:hypothetical protein
MICFFGSQTAQISARELGVKLPPGELGRLRFGMRKAHDIFLEHYRSGQSDRMEADARAVMTDFAAGFVTEPSDDPIRDAAQNYMQGQKILNACNSIL